MLARRWSTVSVARPSTAMTSLPGATRFGGSPQITSGAANCRSSAIRGETMTTSTSSSTTGATFTSALSARQVLMPRANISCSSTIPTRMIGVSPQPRGTTGTVASVRSISSGASTGTISALLTARFSCHEDFARRQPHHCLNEITAETMTSLEVTFQGERVSGGIKSNVSGRLRNTGLARAERPEEGAEGGVAVDRVAVLLHVGYPGEDVADIGPDDLDVLQRLDDPLVGPSDAGVDLLGDRQQVD